MSMKEALKLWSTPPKVAAKNPLVVGGLVGAEAVLQVASSSAKHPFSGATSPVGGVSGGVSGSLSGRTAGVTGMIGASASGVVGAVSGGAVGGGGAATTKEPPMSMEEALKLWSTPPKVAAKKPLVVGGLVGNMVALSAALPPTPTPLAALKQLQQTPSRSPASTGLVAIREEMQKNRRLQADRRAELEEARRTGRPMNKREANAGTSASAPGFAASVASAKGHPGHMSKYGVSASVVGSFSSAFGTAGLVLAAGAGAAQSQKQGRQRVISSRPGQLFSARPYRKAPIRDGRGRILRTARSVTVSPGITVRQLATSLGFSRDRIFAALQNAGENLTKVTDAVDADIAELIAIEAGAKVTRAADPYRDCVRTVPPSVEDLAASGAPFRAPIVTVMGHVDHGKTSLLDALRGAAVAAKEAGGITQGISAFSVAMRAAAQATGIVRAPGGKAARKAAASAARDKDDAAEAAAEVAREAVEAETAAGGKATSSEGHGRRTAVAVKVAAARAAAKAAAAKAKKTAARTAAVAAATAARAAGSIPISSTDVITFLDTPGHALFSSMRRQGSAITDVVVLVVDGTAGVQPQTRECVKLILESGVPCVVAVTKCDGAVDIETAVKRVAAELMSEGLVTEADGGDAPLVPVSARSGLGLEDLKASIALQAEAGGLRSEVNAPGEASVLDSRVAVGLGQVVDAVVRWGTLRVGDVIIAGNEVGRIKALLTDSVAAASLTRRLSGGGGGGDKKTKDGAAAASAAFKMMPVREALPGTPVRVVGLKGAPAAGEDLFVVESEERGKAIVEGRLRRAAMVDAAAVGAVDAVLRAGAHAEYKRRQAMRVALKLASLREKKRVALRRAGQPIPERLIPAPWEIAIIEEARTGAIVGVSAGGRLQRVQGGQQLEAPLSYADAAATAVGGEAGLAAARAAPVVALILRADSTGALAALQAAVARIPAADARVLPRVVSATVGDFTEKDVVYAAEFKASLMGFGATASPNVIKTAERAGVVLKVSPVIYHVLDFLLEHLAEALPAQDVEGVVAAAEVKTTFSLRKGSEAACVIAGCSIIEGEFKMGADKYRVVRDGEILHEAKLLSSLQHLKERVTSVVKGKECGVGLGEWSDFKAGDRIIAVGITKRKQVIKVGWG